MAEEKSELREINFRQLLPWTELFRSFQVALDPKKLLLAAGGIFVMWAGWALLSLIFIKSASEPAKDGFEIQDYRTGNETDKEAEAKRDDAFKREHDKWELLNEAAGDEGKLSSWPGFENRGPNPYLLVTGQGGRRAAEGNFIDWFVYKQIPVLIEPLVKFLLPGRYLLDARAGFWGRVYFILVILWTLATWAIFGGAITRMAAVQFARKEKVGLTEAVRFAFSRFVSFFSAPVAPLFFVLVVVVLCILFGFVHLIGGVGDIWDAILWPLIILAGLAMALILFGLIGWPMMYATISTEGSDAFDALSRSYSYVYQCLWYYLWNCLVAIVYGAAVVFLVGFLGSMMIYLGKWAVSQTPGTTYFDRDPSFLFVYAPTSFEWRDLLLKGSPAERNGVIELGAYAKYISGFKWYNYIGAYVVAIWLYLVFFMIVGFGYSYFWTASTIIYLLMRQKVDDTDLDEVYLEEEEPEETYTPPSPAPATEPAPSAGPALTMVEPPSLKTSEPAPLPPASEGDGNAPSESPSN